MEAWAWASFDVSEPPERVMDWLDKFEEGLEKDAENAKCEEAKRREKEHLRFFLQEKHWWERMVRRGRKMGYLLEGLICAFSSRY
jgi:hypothetical protein